MATRRKLSSNPPETPPVNFALQCEALLRRMENQKETAWEMTRKARQMYNQALEMREEARRRTPLR